MSSQSQPRPCPDCGAPTRGERCRACAVEYARNASLRAAGRSTARPDPAQDALDAARDAYLDGDDWRGLLRAYARLRLAARGLLEVA